MLHPPESFFMSKKRWCSKKYQNEHTSVSLSPNVSTTPLRQWGFQQCLPFSWTTLRGNHCRHPIAVMGVVDTFGPSQSQKVEFNLDQIKIWQHWLLLNFFFCGALNCQSCGLCSLIWWLHLRNQLQTPYNYLKYSFLPLSCPLHFFVILFKGTMINNTLSLEKDF